MIYKFLNSKGQSLVEALIALAAASIVVAAISIAVIAAINNADFGKNQNLATQYSQQGMEILKQKSESNWTTFTSLSGTYCLAENSTTLTIPSGSGCAQNISSFFVRSIVINQNNISCGGNARVVVNTSWSDGKCTSATNKYCHTVSLESCLANINSTQAP